jgi:hypothetical protein
MRIARAGLVELLLCATIAPACRDISPRKKSRLAALIETPAANKFA